jgi:hypothetical protein
MHLQSTTSRSTVRLVAATLFVLITAAAMPAPAATTTFDNGTEGWSVSGRTNISPTGGNPGANLDVAVNSSFGFDIYNDSNPEFLGNYGRFGNEVTISVDVKINSIRTIPAGIETWRRLLIELVDYNEDPNSFYPYVSVFLDLGEIRGGVDIRSPQWRNFAVTIDPTQLTLPTGWGGTGDEDANGNPQLPPDRTFASVLANVEEIRWTTYVPGVFYAFTNFDLQVDNPTVVAVPEPASIGLLLGTGLLSLRRRRC